MNGLKGKSTGTHGLHPQHCEVPADVSLNHQFIEPSARGYEDLGGEVVH